MSANKIASLDQFRREYREEAESQETEGVFPGFTHRLNLLIDKAEGLDIPSINDRGRMAYIHKLTGHSKPAVSDWLQKDTLPRDQTLRSLIAFLLRHIPGEHNVMRVEAWVRFGEEATTNPFSAPRAADDQTALRPLAAKLIAKSSKDMNISVSSYDLLGTMDDVVKMLMDYGVSGPDDIQGPMEDLTKYYIQQHQR